MKHDRMTIFYHKISLTLIYLLRLTRGQKKKKKNNNKKQTTRVESENTWVMTFKGQLFLAK